MLMTRQELKQRFGNLSSQEIAQAANEINGIVLDEIKTTRYQRKSWSVAGFPPLDTSGKEYQRPVAQVRCCLGSSRELEYSIRFVLQWFCD